MRVVWSRRALREWENAVSYIFRKFGIMAVKEFEKDVTLWESLIAQNPELAHQEILLENRSKLYRGLVVNNYSKLIFYVEEDVLYIADLWRPL